MPNGGSVCCNECAYGRAQNRQCDINGTDVTRFFLCRSFRKPHQSHTAARQQWRMLNRLAPGIVYRIENSYPVVGLAPKPAFQIQPVSCLFTPRNENEKYYIKAARGANAEAIVTAEGYFVVRKNSKMADDETYTTPTCAKRMRAQLKNNEVVVDYRFVQDHIFKTPSSAASVVLGRSANGLIEWKQKDGTPLAKNKPPRVRFVVKEAL